MIYDTIEIDGRLYVYSVAGDNVKIHDSQFVRKRYFRSTLERIKELHPATDVWRRSLCSLKREWACHNFLWSYGIARERVKDVDLNYQQKWYVSLAYWIGGTLVWPFVN